ncbi:MAG: hypothetical protein Q6356_002715 [Candidatus Wukongarchaeota archaeon]|nr:hypothetical protein [Candidatus Wukongarchaeota archaeon]
MITNPVFCKVELTTLGIFWLYHCFKKEGEGTKGAGILNQLFYKIHGLIAELSPKLLIVSMTIVTSILYVIALGWYIVHLLKDRAIKNVNP